MKKWTKNNTAFKQSLIKAVSRGVEINSLFSQKDASKIYIFLFFTLQIVPGWKRMSVCGNRV